MRTLPEQCPVCFMRRGSAALVVTALFGLLGPRALGATRADGQTVNAAAPSAAPAPCTVSGIVRAGRQPLPGVVITLTGVGHQGQIGQPSDLGSSGPDGSYLVKAPAPGRYILSGQLMAFAPATREVGLEGGTATGGAGCQARVDLELTLASRAPAERAAKPAAAEGNAGGAGSTTPDRSQNPAAPGGGRGPIPMPGIGRPTNQPQQFRSLALLADQAGLAREDENGSMSESASQALPPGFSPDASTESVTALGSPHSGELFFGPGGPAEKIEAMRQQFGGDSMAMAVAMSAAGLQGPGGGFGGGGRFGGPGGGPGGPGDEGGGPMIFMRGGPGGHGRGNQLRGSFFQSFDTSGLDAGPFALNGRVTPKPSYLQQHFGANIGGPLPFPKQADAPRTFFFVNYTGNHSRNPYDQYSTVPTEAERAGDLSALATGATLVDPRTRLPFGGNQIPSDRIDPAARRLLGLIPLPNQPGTTKNFHIVSTTSNQLDDINVRFIHNFVETDRRPRGEGREGGGSGGGGGRGGGFGGAFGGGFGGGGRGGRGGSNLNVGFHYRHSANDVQNPFPSLGGASTSQAWDTPVGYTFAKRGVFSSLRFQFNRQHSQTTNRYAFNQDIAGQAGLTGASPDPFDWGAPALSFRSFAGLHDVTPSMRTDQTMSAGASFVKSHGAQTLRWGGDFRHIALDNRTDSNARGSFVFTGFYTTPGISSQGGDFADFLLGLPQQATLQYLLGTERLRSRTWNLFIQDDWRANSKLTVNAGVRYEFSSPYSEAGNRLVTLDVPADFSATVPVDAGATGPYSGALSDTIVRPFRTGFAPRVGIAWKPQSSTIVRTGYGINYSNSTYQSIAQQLAAQPPFARTDTIQAMRGIAPASLETALSPGIVPANTILNTFGVDPNYRLGHVQIWNLDIQHDLTRTVMTGIGYTGTRGADLDLLRAPNRTANGVRIAAQVPYIWESSGAESIMHALSLRVRKRLTHGVAAGFTYTLSKSIDNASSIGGGGSVVAQNDQDLAAERGLSSFDQRHRFSGDMTLELPFGPDRRWFTTGRPAALLGNWVLNGSVRLASGTPFTARVLANQGDVARGTNGTLRANYDGEPIALADPTTLAFFNTLAFSPPPSGTFGSAGRNTIIGPGTSNVNMSLTRNVNFGQGRGLTIQLTANNVFNTVQYSAIDTVVNSPTFGQVTAVRSMRRVQVLTRFRF